MPEHVTNEKSVPEVQGAGSQGISEIRGWSDLEGEAGRNECEEYLAEHPELKQEGWKAYNMQGANLHGCWVIAK